MAAELNYLKERTDWARVVETPDSARIIPPDQPPSLCFIGGSPSDRIRSWASLLFVLGLAAFLVFGAGGFVSRVKISSPLTWIDVTSIAVVVLGALLVVGLVTPLVGLLIVAALPERCEILIHTHAAVVRRCRGRWTKTEIPHGDLRTILISGPPHQSAQIRPTIDTSCRVAVLRNGAHQSCLLGRYAYPMAVDVAQAIVRQYQRLGIRPEPRTIDMLNPESVNGTLADAPRYHTIARHDTETRIMPTNMPPPQIQPLQVRITLIFLALTVCALLAHRWHVAFITLAMFFGFAAGMLILGMVCDWAARYYQRRFWKITADELMGCDLTKAQSQRIRIPRTLIRAVQMRYIRERGYTIEVICADAKRRQIPAQRVDAAWELAAILRQELSVPASAPDVVGANALFPDWHVQDVPEPANSLISVSSEGEMVQIHKRCRGLTKGALITGGICALVLLGCVVAAFMLVPRIQRVQDARLALLGCAAITGFIAVVLATAWFEMTESFSFTVSPTELVLRRRQPLGITESRWPRGQIAAVRIQDAFKSLVLEDHAGKVHKLVVITDDNSLRYAATLLRKHLGVPAVAPVAQASISGESSPASEEN